tara:strand:+ start:1175 stop:3124 length:1950 start_codon:yes stop_codon:yes gene_type:complete
MQYRAEIDGLRAVAVLPVILFHAGFTAFSGGFVGVDIFFVISGYLITSIIISELDDGKFKLINFYERRARRILPPLFFVMLVCLPFSWFWLAPEYLKSFGQSLTAVSLFASNVLFWQESGYFDTAAELKPLLHTWSLAVEEQFYIVFPLLLLLIWRARLRFVLLTLTLLLLSSLWIAHWGAYNKPSAAFYLLPTRGWELLLGALLGIYLAAKPYPSSKALCEFFSLVGVSMISYSIVAFDASTPFPSLISLVPTVGTGLLIFSATPGTTAYKILTWRPLVLIGLISYSAYLWHQPLLAFSRHMFIEGLPDYLAFVLCVVSLILAYISWLWIEKPFRDREVTSRKTIFTFSVVGLFSFGLAGLIIDQSEGFPTRVDYPPEFVDSLNRPDKNDCFDRVLDDEGPDFGCFLGAKKDRLDFVFFGDSHSLSLKTIVDELANIHGVSVFYIGASGCIPFLNIYLDRSDQLGNDCFKLNQRVAEFAEDKNIRGIILSAKWSYYTNGYYDGSRVQLISESKTGPFNLEGSRRSFENGLSHTINFYSAVGIPLFVISQPPHQKYHPRSVYFNKYMGRGDISEMSIKRKEFEGLEMFARNTFEQKYREINYLYTLDLFCNNKICPIGDATGSYYYDENHLSEFGARKLENLIQSIFVP